MHECIYMKGEFIEKKESVEISTLSFFYFNLARKLH